MGNINSGPATSPRLLLSQHHGGVAGKRCAAALILLWRDMCSEVGHPYSLGILNQGQKIGSIYSAYIIKVLNLPWRTNDFLGDDD